MGIDLYFNPASPPARAVLLLAKHLDVELNLITLDLFKGEQLKPEFVAINPQHTVPTLVDNGFIVAESRAVLTYIHNKYGGKEGSLYPTDVQQRAMVDMRLFFDGCTLYPRFGETVYPIMLANQPFDQAKVDKLYETLAFVEIFLKDGNFIAGKQLSIADFSLASTLCTISECHEISKFPKTVAYLEKCKAVMKGYEELNQDGAIKFSQYYKGALAKQNA